MATNYIESGTYAPMTDGDDAQGSVTKALVMSATLRQAYAETGGDNALINLSRLIGNTSLEPGGGGVNVAREVARRGAIMARRSSKQGGVVDNGFIRGVLSAYVSRVRGMFDDMPGA